MSYSVTLSALRSEFSADPSGIGYGTAFTNRDASRLCFLINTISANSNTTNSVISVGLAYALQLQNVVVASEFSTLTTTQKDLWNVMMTTAVQGLVISSTSVRGQISFIWSGTSTGNLLSALRYRSCSRAETLFGEGASVNPNEASKAAYGDF